MTSGERVSSEFLFRVPSFSLIYFSGDVYDHIPTFLTRLGYSIVGRGNLEGEFPSVIDALGIGGKRTVVHKAAYRVTGGTVLLDPEMVVGLSKLVGEFCAGHSVEAVVSIWERVSETVIARRRSGDAVLSEFHSIGGRVIKPPTNVPKDLVDQPGPLALKAFLATAGVPVDEVFGWISVRAFKLGQ